MDDKAKPSWLAWRIKMLPIDLAFIGIIALLFWIAS